MKVVALLSAYDESPAWLAVVVAGVGRFADAVVYVDGGYMLFPGARPRSMPDQAESVMAAAEAADLECVIHRPKDIWRGNEVEKRNQTLALAGAVGADWVAVFDADMHLMKCNRDSVRHDLEHTDAHVATMTVLEGKDILSDRDVASVAQITDLDHEWTSRQRLLYRWSPSLRYGPLHWSVRCGAGWLWGPHDLSLLPALDLNGSLVTYHRRIDRTALRRQAQDEYYKTRDMFGVEKMEVLA